MFVEHDRFDVRRIDDHVDDRELGVREVRGDLGQRVTKGKAGHDDRVCTGFGQTTQRLFALGFVLHFQFLERAAGFFGPTGCAIEGRFVEALVELATKIEDDRRFCRSGAREQGEGASGPGKGFHEAHRCSLPVDKNTIAPSAGFPVAGDFCAD